MTLRTTLRGLTLAILALWIVAAPAYRQLFGGRARWVPAWDLYSEVGEGLVRARFVAVRGGARELLDRYAALGYADRRSAPRWLRTIRGEAGALKVARALCERAGPGAAIAVDGVIAGPAGWEPLFADVADLCQPLPPRPIRRRRRG